MYGVSFLIALVNSALVAMVYPLFFRNTSVKPSFLNLPSRKGKIAIASAAMLLTAFSAIHGYVTMSKPIAGNIEQTKKWDPAYAREIMQILADLTRKASKDQPALIIWPEAAIPGAINQNVGLHFEVRNIAKNAGAHLLLGSVQNRKFVEKGAKEVKSFNSAFLIDPQPTTYKNHRYNKIRLFPFGEYLPLKGIMPWSYINLGNTNESIPGKEFTVFELHNSHFGAMICWETVFPELVRQFVRRGAQFMVNISNEAHFAEAATHYQFVSSSVFRAVENRVFVIRCANAGVSCIIDPNGRIVKKVKDATGRDIFVRGVMSGWIVPLESKTIYTRYGDLLVFLAFVVSAVFLFAALLHNR